MTDQDPYEGMPQIIFSAEQVAELGGPAGVKAVVDAAVAEYRRRATEVKASLPSGEEPASG